MKLQLGDIGCTRNPMALGRAINAAQKFWSSDNQSEYSHSLIITNSLGGTFESLWKIRHGLLSAYIGQKVLIGRLKDIPKDKRLEALKQVIIDHEGEIYPFWRLGLHLIPPLAKYISSGKYPVCSELMFKFVKLCGIGRIGKWQGKNPDHAADFIKYADECEVVFEDILTAEALNELTGRN